MEQIEIASPPNELLFNLSHENGLGGNSNIEWTQQTWNPVTGCTKVSPGCKFCYAEKMHNRLNGMGTPGYEEDFNGKVILLEDRLNVPLERKKPTIYFVNSMSDLFHPDVPNSFILKVFNRMNRAEQHTFQVLTKRAERMATFCKEYRRAYGYVPSNIWLGVSVENQKDGLPRVAHLQDAPYVNRFLSVEPLLEDLDNELDLTDIKWVIVGGESGNKNVRPMDVEWVRKIRDQCIEREIAFFFKQWGSYGADGKYRRKKENGRMLDGRIWDMLPFQKIGVLNERN